MPREDKLLPIRAPESIHKRLKHAAKELDKKTVSHRVTVNEVGLTAVLKYLDQLESTGQVPPYHEDGDTPDA